MGTKLLFRGQRFALLIFLSFLMLVVILRLLDRSSFTNEFLSSSHSAPIECYDDTTSNQIEDISESPPPKPDSIFFHETSCSSAFGNGDFVFSPRQACAVESAAKANPSLDIYVLFLSPIRLNNISNSQNQAIRALLSYPNIHLKHANIERYMKNTPLERWYKTDALKKSNWPTSHASDVLRYLTLWKYSGTYLDLDVVVLKSLRSLRNYACAESPRSLGAGVINLDSTSIGRSMASEFVAELLGSFSGSDWGGNGPGVITRVLQRICHVKKVQDMTAERCGGFSIYPPSAFYPISFESWEDYFSEEKSNATLLLHADSYLAHLSNKFSASKKITVGSRQPYGLLAAQHCPLVYATCKTVF